MSKNSNSSFEDFDFYDLRVPAGTDNMTLCDAALAWADEGFYVLPINNATKHAGSVLGKGWPEKTSRDQVQIKNWFKNESNGLAIHVGRSGALVFDVDDPDSVPVRLQDWMCFKEVPFQATRVDNPLRGHYMFAINKNKSYGNSNGALGRTWGEVRGKNGIIVVAPTRHSKFDQGGNYKWMRTGVVPPLPVELESKLKANFHTSVEAIELSEVENFFKSYSENNFPEVLYEKLEKARIKFLHESRHNTARDLLLNCLRDSIVGLYPAQTAVQEVLVIFQTYKPRQEWSSDDEFLGIVRWAIAQVLNTGEEQLNELKRFYDHLKYPNIQDWLEKHR